MTSSDVWDEEAARYDETSAEMFAPDVLEPAVDFLARLAGDGPALELAIGTGRVAMPLAARGVPVSGVELSQPMVDQLRRKAAAEDLPVVTGESHLSVWRKPREAHSGRRRRTRSGSARRPGQHRSQRVGHLVGLQRLDQQLGIPTRPAP